MSQKIFLLTFKGNCMNFSLELKFFILSHPVTSKHHHKIVQRHPVCKNHKKWPTLCNSFHCYLYCKGKREKEKWLEGNRTAKNWANCERNLPQNCKECYVIWHVCSLWLTTYVYLCALHTRTKSMFDSQ